MKLQLLYDASLWLFAAAWGIVAGGLIASRGRAVYAAGGLAKTLLLPFYYGSVYPALLSAASLAFHTSIAILAVSHTILVSTLTFMARGEYSLIFIHLYLWSRSIVDAAGLAAAASAATLLALRAYAAIRGIKPPLCSLLIEAGVIACYLLKNAPYAHIAAAVIVLGTLTIASMHFGRVARLYSKAILPRLAERRRG